MGLGLLTARMRLAAMYFVGQCIPLPTKHSARIARVASFRAPAPAQTIEQLTLLCRAAFWSQLLRLEFDVPRSSAEIKAAHAKYRQLVADLGKSRAALHTLPTC